MTLLQTLKKKLGRKWNELPKEEKLMIKEISDLHERVAKSKKNQAIIREYESSSTK